MYANDLARAIAHWARAYQFCGEVNLSREDDLYIVAFEARTTKTRASSMVTRLKLIVGEVAQGAATVVDKELVSNPPKSRDAIASWKIFVNIPIRKKGSGYRYSHMPLLEAK